MNSSAPTFTFQMCSERSGSNFTARLFDAHPDFCGPSPVHLVRLICDHAMRWGDLREDDGWLRFVQDVVALLDSKVGVWRTGWTTDRLLEEVRERTPGAVLRHVLLAEARANGKTRLFIKENHLWRYLPFIFSAFPGAGVVVQVRDPRDMALSWKKRDELRGDVLKAASTWKEDQSHALTVLGPLRLEGRAIAVRYEDLVDDPEGELLRLCAFLGAGWSPEMLRFHEDRMTRENARAAGAWENLSKPVIKGNHGKWKGGLSEDEVRYIEWTCGPEMTAFGYALDEDPPADPAEIEALRQRLAAVERHEKPGYQEVAEEERRRRAARADVVKALAARPLLSAIR